MNWFNIKKTQLLLCLIAFIGCFISKGLVELAFSSMIIVWLLDCIIQKSFPWSYMERTWLYLLFLSFMFFSASRSVIWTEGLAAWLNLLEYVLVIIIVRYFGDIRPYRHTCFYLIIICSFLLGMDCIYQYLTDNDFLRNRLINVWHDFRRLTGPFVHPNSLGGFLAMLLPFTFCFTYEKLGPKKKVLLGLALLIQVVCLLGTYSRGAWIGVLAGLYCVALLKDWKLFIYSGILIGMSFFLLPNQVMKRMMQMVDIHNITTQLRLDTWLKAWDLFIKDPWFGIGLGNFSQILKEGYPHNNYLEILTESGVLGLVVFLIFLFFHIQGRPLKNPQDSAGNNLQVGFLAMIWAFLVHAFFDTNFHVISLAGLFWMSIGFLQNLRLEIKN